jgi:hypothetical protein
MTSSITVMVAPALCAGRAVSTCRKEWFRFMAEEPTLATFLDEQLDGILGPLGVRREVASLDEQLDGILGPLGVRRETSIDTVDRPALEGEEGPLRVSLYFISVLCEWPDAPHLKERLEQLLASAEAPSADVLPGMSRASRCYFMIVATAPFPPSLFEQLRALKEIHDSFEFITALDLGTDSDESHGAAGGV